MKWLKKTAVLLLSMSMILSLFAMPAAFADDNDSNSVRVLVRVETPDKTLVYPTRIDVKNFSLQNYGAKVEKAAPTALHALLTALGMDASGPDNATSIDADTGSLAKVEGYEANAYYGWYYTVNDTWPTVSAGDYQLQDGDELVFYYIDSEIGSYSYFTTSEKTAAVGEKIAVNLYSIWFDDTNKQHVGPVEKADILVSKAGGEDATENTSVQTDSLGYAALTFTEPGVYVVSAKRYGDDKNTDTSDISRPRMTITVTGDSTSAGDGTSEKATITTNEGGSAVLSSDGKTITITPSEGYRVKDVTVNGTSVGAVTSYELPDSQLDAQVAVTFEKKNSESTGSQTGNSTANIDGFTDIANHWALPAIQYVVENNLFYGTTDTMFSPNMTMTRGMFVTVLGRFAKASAVDGSTNFTDVDSEEYYAPYVAWASEQGIVKGITDTTFDPNAPITREQAVAILYRYADSIESDVSNIEGMAIYEYSDYDQISDWAKTPIRYGINAGILTGRDDGSFDPQGTATRAEVATMLEKFIEHIN